MTEQVPAETNAWDAEPEELSWRGVGGLVRGAWRRLGDVTSDRRVAWGIMIVILLIAGIYRFTGLDWDEHQHLHPDERFLTMVENSLKWPKSLGEYFDTAKNPLNPYNHGHGTYVYGISPVVLAKAIGEVIGKTGYDGVYLAGRGMNAVLDMLSVLLVFIIGRRLYDARVGLLGALLLSLSVLNIQQAHFFTVDTSTTLFVTLALYFAVRVAQGGGWGSVVMLGVSFGLAVSAKISVLSFLGVIVLAYGLRVLAHQGEEGPLARLLDVQGRLGRFSLSLRIESDEPLESPAATTRLLLEAIRAGFSLLVVIIVAFVVFRVVQPQAFTGPGFFGLKLNPAWLKDMGYISKLVSGEIDYPPSHQWAAREPVWYAFKNLVLWGLGLPLGLTAWAGWALMAYELVNKRKWQHLLPWVWMTFTFFYQSIQFVKTIRYMLPIYPVMALMAGYALIRLWDWAQARRAEQGAGAWRRWAAYAARGLIAFVILGTAFWATAFLGIYLRPVTRVAASRWIYANIPRGTSISFEHWDDGLPLNVDHRNANLEYKMVRMDLYWEDIPEKRQQLYNWLRETEYIVLSSNRLYGSIPRLPTRYPMTTRYYEALFSGELGYERIQTFTSRPRLFGIEINDDDADETFTVYDHPKVIIFKKRADFSMEKVEELFGGYDLQRIVRVTPLQVTKAPNNLMLDGDTWAIQRSGGTWTEIFDRDSLSNRLPTLFWLLALFAIGAIAFPLGFVAFWRLRDRGYILSKTLGLLLVTYLVWLWASVRLAPYTRASIAGALVILTLISVLVAWAQRRAMAQFIRARWRLLVANEVLFLLFFLVFWLIRRGNPDLWHPAMGGEKPMDLAYLNAIIKSTYFPPYDPWFAGGYINYYYYGWVVVATLIKLTGIVPWVAYNLTIPTLFALVAMGASCVVFNLMPRAEDEATWLPRALRYGIVGALLVAVAGNLGEVKLLLNGLQELGKTVKLESTLPGLVPLVRAAVGLWAVLAQGKQMPFRPEWWYWNASRVMGHGEINEFPFFTFLYADLHAHLIAMPFALLALGLAVGVLARPQGALSALARDEAAEGQGASLPGWLRWAQALVNRWRHLDWALGLQLTLMALVVGELWCNNTWDFPTYLGISVAALAIGIYAERQRVDVDGLLQWGARAAYVLALSMLLYRPYHANFGSAYGSIEPWKGERTRLDAYLIIHGTFLFILASYLFALAFARGMRNGVARTLRLFATRGERRGRALHLYALLVSRQTLAYDLAWVGLVVLVAVLLVLALTRAWILFLVLPLLTIAGLLTLYRRATPEGRLQTLLIAVGLAATLAVEYVVIKGDIGRMNTVFKFYLQVWIMWGVVAAVGLAHLAGVRWSWPPTLRRGWGIMLGVLLFGVALYPIFATYGKVRDRWNPMLPAGLDGMNYMTVARYHDNNREIVLEHDRQAITWLQDHVEGSPVIAEANTPLYRWGSRISIYTGLPTIIGWDWHQKQQRAAFSGEVVDWRLQDLRDLYNTRDTALAARILSRYQVGYIYVGELEKAYYDPQGLAKFDRMVGETLDIAYQKGPVTIYRVRDSGAREIAASRGRAPALARLLRLLHPSAWLFTEVHAQGPHEPNSPPEAAPTPKAKLMLDVPVEQLPVLRDRGWNRLLRGSTPLAVLAWWLVLELVGLAAWPLARQVTPGFQDGGYALAKGLGLLLVGYVVWVGSSLRLLANSPPVAWLALAAVGASAFFLWRRRRPEAAARPCSRRLILIEEGLFTLAYLAFVGVRILNPDLWQPWFGGEKMMEIAFLNAITKSAYMPPYDPYFADGHLNYYYYGQFLVSLLIKLTGVTPEVGFNLAVPTFFALTVAHTFTLGYHLAMLAGDGRRAPTEGGLLHREGLWGGAAAVVLVALIGNLTGALQVLEQLARAGGASFAGDRPSWGDLQRVIPGLIAVLTGRAEMPPFDYWYRATRVIPYTINEFPFFSFLFADLHPHMINIPFTLLVIGLCLATLGAARESRLGTLLRWGALAVAVGALGPINTWDLPTYLGLLGCAMLYRSLVLGRARGLAEAAVSFLVVFAGAVLLYSPFYAHYQAQYVGVALVPPQERTHLVYFLIIWGFLIFLACSAEAMWLSRTGPTARLMRMAARYGWARSLRRVAAWAKLGGASVALGLVVGLIAALIAWRLLEQEMWLLALLEPLLIAAGMALVSSGKNGAAFLQRLMLFVGLGILLGVEIIYMKDFLAGGEWRRMNTVFKFYLQAWVLIGLTVGSALPALWRHFGEQGFMGGVWQGGALLLLGLSLIYTVMAVPARVNERFDSGSPPIGTLDGTAYMQAAIYAWPDASHPIVMKYDREAIAWLWENVEGTPVIAEAPLGFYREGGLRVSSYTGLPTIIGFHEIEQRPWEQIGTRESDAAAIYTTTDLAQLRAILERYRVRYIYIGQLERIAYPGPGLAKFEELAAGGFLSRVFHNERVDIYRVVNEKG